MMVFTRGKLCCVAAIFLHVFSQVHELPLLANGIDLSELSDTDTVAILLPQMTLHLH